MRSRTISLCLNALAGYGLLAVMPVQGAGSLGPVGGGLVIAFLVLSLVVHEVAHAWVALQRGDPTARDLGRITLNPLPHIDPVMTVIMPLTMGLLSGWTFVFGGAKPVPVNATRLRNPIPDMALVALAGPVSNWLLAIVFGALYKLSLLHGFYPGAAASITERSGQLFPLVMEAVMFTNLFLAVFNLIPIPPLDGSRVMNVLLPAPMREAYMRLEFIGLILVMALWFYGPVQPIVLSAVRGMSRLIFAWVPA